MTASPGSCTTTICTWLPWTPISLNFSWTFLALSFLLNILAGPNSSCCLFKNEVPEFLVFFFYLCAFIKFPGSMFFIHWQLPHLYLQIGSLLGMRGSYFIYFLVFSTLMLNRHVKFNKSKTQGPDFSPLNQPIPCSSHNSVNESYVMSDAQNILKTLLFIHLSYTLHPIYEVKLLPVLSNYIPSQKPCCCHSDPSHYHPLPG